MNQLFSATFIALALYVFLGGIPLFRKSRIPKKPKLINRQNKQNKKIDQEFLEYLWVIKSELSTGALINQIDKNTPNHKLTSRLQLILDLSKETGTSVIPVLNRFIKQTKNQIELKQEIESELASTKATIAVLACLPVFGLGLGRILNANSFSWLVQTSFGRFCFLMGIILNLLGILWVNQIIRRSLNP